MEQRKTFEDQVTVFNDDLRRVLELMGIYKMLEWIVEKLETHWNSILITMWSASILLVLSMFIAGIIILIR